VAMAVPARREKGMDRETSDPKAEREQGLFGYAYGGVCQLEVLRREAALVAV
jgi:hypothetical protein